MRQIRFRLGHRPRPRWRSSQRPPSWILKGPASTGREEGKKGAREGRGNTERSRKGRDKRGREGRRAPPIKISGYATGAPTGKNLGSVLDSSPLQLWAAASRVKNGPERKWQFTVRGLN